MGDHTVLLSISQPLWRGRYHDVDQVLLQVRGWSSQDVEPQDVQTHWKGAQSSSSQCCQDFHQHLLPQHEHDCCHCQCLDLLAPVVPHLTSAVLSSNNFSGAAALKVISSLFFTKNLEPSFNINNVFLDLGGRDRQGRGSEVEAHWPETQSDTRSRQKGCHGYILRFWAIEHHFHNCKLVAQVMNEVCRKHKIDLKIWWSHNVAGMKLSQDFVFAPIWRTKKDCVACTQLYVTRNYAKKNIYQYIGGYSCFLSIWSVQQPLFICSRKG